MTTLELEILDATDGLRIAFRSWRPADQARGIFVVVPGFNSHSGYYQWVAEQLTDDGLIVHAVDLRGRGRSFDRYVSDVSQIITAAKARDPGLPVILRGHSAGGVVACLYALGH